MRFLTGPMGAGRTARLYHAGMATTATSTMPASAGPIGPVLALAGRELIRLSRQRGRVIGAVATPLLLWAMLGVGFNRAVVLPGAAGPEAGAGDGPGYLAYFYPGMILMVVLFSSIFSTITVIEDRKEGFLQAVLVSPASRLSIVLGKVLGGAGVATIQGVVLLAAWPIVGGWPGVGPMLGAVGMLAVISVALTALGLCFAWRMDSAGAFHGVMSLVLMPMWLLSGAMFPLASAGMLRYVMVANPLTYGHAAFAGLLQGSTGGTGVTPGIAAGIMLAFTAAILAGAVYTARQPSRTGV